MELNEEVKEYNRTYLQSCRFCEKVFRPSNKQAVHLPVGGSGSKGLCSSCVLLIDAVISRKVLKLVPEKKA